jgi:hypothetical protein
MDFPTTPDAYDRSFNGGYNDIFLSKLSSTGESLLYSTYLGGSGREGSCGIAVDGSDNSIIAGGTSSVDFPTTSDAFSKSLNGSNDVFIAKFNSTGTNLLYSTYLGGSESDSAYRMALDGNGNVYVIGRPSSMDFPTTPDAYDRSFNGGYSDAFVTKIQIPYLLTLSSTTGGTTDPTPGVHKYSAGTEVTITALPDVHYQFEQWSGDLSGADNPIIINMDSDKSITAHFVLINPPLNFTGQKVLNRSLSQAEYINILTWQANPNNTNVTKYRIYQIEGESQDLVIELSAGTFQHWHRKVEKDKLYTYAICAVTDEGREGQPTHITVQ